MFGMDAGVTTPVIGLIGAVVGSPVTLVGSYPKARSDRDLAFVVRTDAVLDATTRHLCCVPHPRG